MGYLEEIDEAEELIHKHNGLLILSVDPISLGIFKSPGEWGADIAIGEGQSLGNPMSLRAKFWLYGMYKNLMRKMPGRIVGQTKDREVKEVLYLLFRPGNSTYEEKKQRLIFVLIKH